MNGIYGFDLTVFKAVNVGLHRVWLDPVFLVLSYVGLGQVQAVLSLVLACWRSTRKYVWPLLLTIFVAGIPVAQGLKSLIPRDRPSNLPFAIREEPHLLGSFPSGHTTTSFAVATMLFLLTRGTNHRWVGQVAFVIAALIGFSRMYRGVHWPTDVIGGACAGTASACLVGIALPYVTREGHSGG